MKRVNFLFLLPVFSGIYCQTVDIAESTLKINGMAEEVFYYGFAEGDQLIFNFEEVKGKELKEVEIIEMPSSSKFMDYKTTKIENKTITITKTGIYKFRFANSAIMGRICKFKIQRVPAGDATKNFNTSVYWRTVYDTTTEMVDEKYLVKADTIVSNIVDEVAKVHSSTNLNGNRTSFNFLLPPNTVAWSYYIGVDQAGQEAYEHATAQLAKKAGPALARMPGYGPLAALALGGLSYLSVFQAGEDIDFHIVNSENYSLYQSGQPFYYVKKGKVINDFSRITNVTKGMHYVCLSNDNAVQGVTVAVKITCIVVNKEWGTRKVKKYNVNKREEAYLKE